MQKSAPGRHNACLIQFGFGNRITQTLNHYEAIVGGASGEERDATIKPTRTELKRLSLW
jgi:hypothetical protein